MIIPDKKKAAGLIVSRLKDGREVQSVEKPEMATDGRREAMRAIASELLSAVQNGSSSDIATALEAFHNNMGVSED